MRGRGAAIADHHETSGIRAGDGLVNLSADHPNGLVNPVPVDDAIRSFSLVKDRVQTGEMLMPEQVLDFFEGSELPILMPMAIRIGYELCHLPDAKWLIVLFRRDEERQVGSRRYAAIYRSIPHDSADFCNFRKFFRPVGSDIGKDGGTCRDS